MYNELVAALTAIQGLPGAEHEWATRPAGDHLTVQLDFAAGQDAGDDRHQNQAYEGSVDLYTKGQGWTTAAAVETVLEAHCGSAWRLNSKQYERETGLLHREYVFEIEAL